MELCDAFEAFLADTLVRPGGSYMAEHGWGLANRAINLLLQGPAAVAVEKDRHARGPRHCSGRPFPLNRGARPGYGSFRIRERARGR